MVILAASAAAQQKRPTAAFLQNNRFTDYQVQNVVASPNGIHVFASGTGDSTSIFTLTIQQGGSLQLTGAPAQDATAAQALLAVHPRGTQVYAAFQTGMSPAQIVAYNADPVTGALSPAAKLTESATADPTSLVVDPAGRNLYVLRGQLAMYSISSDTLTLVTGYSASGITGVSMALSPNGRFAVVARTAASGPGWLTVYPRDPVTGALQARAIDSARTATSSPQQVAVLGNGFAYLTENNGTGVDLISRYAVDSATGRLTRGFTPTRVTTYDSTAGGTAGPFLAPSPSGAFLMVTGYLASDGTWGSHPGYVSAFNVNANGSLTLNNSITNEVAGVFTGGIASSAITVDPYGQFAYTANTGNAYSWQAVDAYSTGYSPFDAGNAMARGPVRSFSRDSLVFTDSLLVPQVRRFADTANAVGFALYRLGFDKPRSQAYVHTISGAPSPTFGDVRTIRAAVRLPLPRETNAHQLFEDTSYAFRAYVVTNRGTFYGPSIQMSVQPFVRTDSVAPSFRAVRDYVDLTASVRPDRYPGTAGFLVSSDSLFSGQATRAYVSSIYDSEFSQGLLRDSLASGVFFVRAFGVFGSDTIFGARKSFTNAPVIAMRLDSTKSTSAIFYLTVQPWAVRPHSAEIRRWEVTTGAWERVKTCFDNAQCTVTGLTAGNSYVFQAWLTWNGTVVAKTSSITVRTLSGPTP